MFDENDLPVPLKGKKDILFSCFDRVFDFHDKTFYSLLEKHSGNIKQLLQSVSEQISVSYNNYKSVVNKYAIFSYRLKAVMTDFHRLPHKGLL